jgi:Flp pilus assembly protein TadB
MDAVLAIFTVMSLLGVAVMCERAGEKRRRRNIAQRLARARTVKRQRRALHARRRWFRRWF